MAKGHLPMVFVVTKCQVSYSVCLT